MLYKLYELFSCLLTARSRPGHNDNQVHCRVLNWNVLLLSQKPISLLSTNYISVKVVKLSEIYFCTFWEHKFNLLLDPSFIELRFVLICTMYIFSCWCFTSTLWVCPGLATIGCCWCIFNLPEWSVRGGTVTSDLFRSYSRCFLRLPEVGAYVIVAADVSGSGWKLQLNNGDIINSTVCPAVWPGAPVWAQTQEALKITV